ncbi:hypothetical protein P167DRAFT_565315 [Morchella conica CCBAS932]|uniref:Uncharacterized protein n=1 Tax=Morchella conica CCBAS932 TaxID=1392247 RepID=A0A3N4KRW0_9PEZI|nr:hypothetical protein P167DRAFT_565315 [Morchella conica CCBAS932]
MFSCIPPYATIHTLYQEHLLYQEHQELARILASDLYRQTRLQGQAQRQQRGQAYVEPGRQRRLNARREEVRRRMEPQEPSAPRRIFSWDGIHRLRNSPYFGQQDRPLQPQPRIEDRSHRRTLQRLDDPHRLPTHQPPPAPQLGDRSRQRVLDNLSRAPAEPRRPLVPQNVPRRADPPAPVPVPQRRRERTPLVPWNRPLRIMDAPGRRGGRQFRDFMPPLQEQEPEEEEEEEEEEERGNPLKALLARRNRRR